MNGSDLGREAGWQEMGQECIRGDGGLRRQTWLNLSGFSSAGRMGKQRQQVAEGGAMSIHCRLTGSQQELGLRRGHQCCKEGQGAKMRAWAETEEGQPSKAQP